MRFHHVYFNKTEGGNLYSELQSQLKQILKSAHFLSPEPSAENVWPGCHAAGRRRQAFFGFLKPVNSIELIKRNVLPGTEKLKHRQAES